MTEPSDHWNAVYTARDPDALTWFEAAPALSLEMIVRHCAADQPVIDVGGGASSLPDALLAKGFRDVTVLDLSTAALAVSKARLGPDAGRIRWIVGDVTAWRPEGRHALWHDRAVLHFLTDPADKDAYIGVLVQALVPGGHAMIATFAEDGPEMCSNLPVQRYSPMRWRRGWWPGRPAFSHRSRRGAMSMSRPWGESRRFRCPVFSPVRRALIIQPRRPACQFRRKVRPHSGPRPGADGDADRAALRLVEEGQAGVEVDIPFRLAPHGLLVGPDRGGRAGVLADAAGGAKKASMPCSAGGVGAKGASVSTAARRNEAPMSRSMTEPCLPSSPNPQASAGGIIATGPVIGPVTGSAAQPCCRNQPVTVLAASAARPYWRSTSTAAGMPGASAMASGRMLHAQHDDAHLRDGFAFVDPIVPHLGHAGLFAQPFGDEPRKCGGPVARVAACRRALHVGQGHVVDRLSPCAHRIKAGSGGEWG